MKHEDKSIIIHVRVSNLRVEALPDEATLEDGSDCWSLDLLLILSQWGVMNGCTQYNIID